MATTEELMTFKEAQEYLGISRVKMWKLAKEGSLPVYTDPLDKRKKLVPRAEVEKLKQPQAVKGPVLPERKTFSIRDNPPPAAPIKPAAATEVRKHGPIPLSEVAKMPLDEAVRLSRPE